MIILLVRTSNIICDWTLYIARSHLGGIVLIYICLHRDFGHKIILIFLQKLKKILQYTSNTEMEESKVITKKNVNI